MVKRWKPIALLLATFLLAVSLKNDFLYFLLGFELMVDLALSCQVSWLAGKMTARVQLPQPLVLRGENFQVRAELANDSRLPVPQLMLRLAVRAYPEREELLLKGKLMLDGRERGSLCFQLDSTHCGCLEIRPNQLVVTDFLGVFQRRCRVDSREKSLLFILPEVLRSRQPLPEAQGLFPEGEEDNGTQGMEAMDVSEIRSYREGDSLKQVHWKLTARLNELMVREMTDPTEKLTWLYLKLQESPQGPRVRSDPDAWDHFVETVASVSAALLNLEKRHMVVWMDGRDSTVVRHSVSDETSLQEMLCSLLRADTIPQGARSPALKEILSDETKASCIEIDLQGNLVRGEMP